MSRSREPNSQLSLDRSPTAIVPGQGSLANCPCAPRPLGGIFAGPGAGPDGDELAHRRASAAAGLRASAAAGHAEQSGRPPDSRPDDPTHRSGGRPAAGGGARPGHRDRPRAGLPGCRRVAEGAGPVAAEPVHRAELDAARRSGPGRPGARPDDQQELPIPPARTAAGGSSISGPVPAGGPAQVSGLTSILRISDAIFEPLAARQVVAARRAGVQAATNDALLGVAEAYLDLQQAAGRLAIAREAAANAEELSLLTGSYARTGAGLEADHRRSLAERDRRKRDVEEAVGDLETASAELVRRVRLDPRVVVAPVEPPEMMFRLVPDAASIDGLITSGLRHRPELAEAQALVQATLVRLKQAKLRPFIPSVAFRYSGGGFGGGTNGFFGDFGGRSDADVNLFWELQNLGFANRAIAKSRASQERTAHLELLKVQDRVASEVVRADKSRLAALRQVGGLRRPSPRRSLPSLSTSPASARGPASPAPLVRSRSSSPSRPSPRPAPTTSKPSSPSTAPSSASSTPSAGHRSWPHRRRRPSPDWEDGSTLRGHPCRPLSVRSIWAGWRSRSMLDVSDDVLCAGRLRSQCFD